MRLLALALLAYALIKLIRALPHTPESQPEPDEQDSEGRGIWARLEADPAFRERMLRAAEQFERGEFSHIASRNPLTFHSGTRSTCPSCRSAA